MLKPLVSRFLQHITSQNNWSKLYLMSYAGKILQLEIAFIKSNLLILEDGSLAIAGDTSKPDVTILISPSLALRLIAKDESAKMQIKVEGDTHLATEVSKVLQQMHWDIEEDISKVIGDIPANKLANTSGQIAHEIKKQSINIAEMLAEYWQEENLILAKERHVTTFNNEVDNLRSDIERLQKRLEKQDQKYSKNLQESPL